MPIQPYSSAPPVDSTFPLRDVSTESANTQVKALQELVTQADRIDIILPTRVDPGYINGMMSSTLSSAYSKRWPLDCSPLAKVDPYPEPHGVVYENFPSKLEVLTHIPAIQLRDQEKAATEPNVGFRTILSLIPRLDALDQYRVPERAWQTLAILYFSHHYGRLACRTSVDKRDKAGLIINFKEKSPSSDVKTALENSAHQYPIDP